jgi:hypothetical protein
MVCEFFPPRAFTPRQPLRDRLRARPRHARRGARSPLSFLFKCILCLGVVFWFLPWRSEPAEAEKPAPPPAARKDAARAKSAATRDAALGSILDEAAAGASAALARTARDFCENHAAQCISAAANAAGLAPTDDKRLKSKGK